MAVDANNAAATGSEAAADIRLRLHGKKVHVPAHFDAEILSAVGRIRRAEKLTDDDVMAILHTLRHAPFSRHLLQDLVEGAWSRRENLRLVDALYVELAEQLRVPLITTDARLAQSYPQAEVP